MNFMNSETDQAVVMWCPISFEFLRHLRCIVGETMDFPDLEVSTTITAILMHFDDSCVWKESRTYGTLANRD